MAAPTASEPRAAAGDDRLSELVADDSRLAIGLHYASLGVTFVVVAVLCRKYWYFNDDFLVQSLIRDRGVRGVFEPYAEHWMSVPKLLAHLNYALVGFKTYWPTTLLVLATNTVVGHLLWRVMRQAGLSAWIATGLVAVYLGLPNYTNNLLTLGFTEEDIAAPGSDRLVDALVAWGDADTIAARVREHHDAGADHVAVQVVTSDAYEGLPLPQWRELAPALTG